MNITDNLRDATYIVIGMGVIGAQRAQVRREELRKQFAEQRTTLETQGAAAVKLVSDLIKQADARVEPLVQAVEAQIDTAVARLPEQAKPLVETARAAAKDARQQVRSAVIAG
jgi:hypothetical protein